MSILTSIRNLFVKKGEITKDILDNLETLKRLYPVFDYMQANSHAVLIYNGYPIAKAYGNLYLKQFSWETLTTDFESFQIKEIYKKLDGIYKELKNCLFPF